MRKTLFVLMLGLLIAGSSFGQFQKKSWMVSGAGFADLGGFNTEMKYQTGTQTFNMAEGDYVFSTRFTYFVIDKLGIGLDAQIDIDGEGMEPDNAAAKAIYDEDFKSADGQTTMFIGPIVRYYIPIGKLVAIFPEVSFGYRNYGEIDYIEGKRNFDLTNPTKIEKYENKTVIAANGFGFNVGLGVAFKLSKRFALDFTGRFGGGKISGQRKDESSYPTSANYSKVPDTDVDVKFANIDFMIGFQVFFGEPKKK